MAKVTFQCDDKEEAEGTYTTILEQLGGGVSQSGSSVVITYGGATDLALALIYHEKRNLEG